MLVSIGLSAQQWTSSYAEAQALAQQDGKSIVLVFSGSDWCAPCIKLDREIWQDASFQEQAGKEFVFYRADFPRKKDNQLDPALATENAQLAERYNQRGSFPLVVVLDAEGRLLGQTGYQKLSPGEYLTVLEGLAK